MKVDVTFHNRPEDDREDDRHERIRTRRDIQTILEQIMALSAQVAAALEQARKLDNVVDAVNAGFAALQKQVADLKDQIVNNTPSLSDEDKAALAEITSELQENIGKMPAQIVENTGQTGSSGSTGEVVPAEPVANDPAPPSGEVAPQEPAPTEPPAQDPNAQPQG